MKLPQIVYNIKKRKIDEGTFCPLSVIPNTKMPAGHNSRLDMC